jgi:hypothetical protein
MTKLNDTIRILLASAAQREDLSLLPLPASLTANDRVAKAIASLVGRGFAAERDTISADTVHRTDGDLRFGVFATRAGLTAIGVEVADDLVPEREPELSAAAVDSPPKATKAALVLTLLHRDQGATLPELIETTGWLPHTTRAALTRIRKKGYMVEKAKRGDVTCYRIVGVAA